MEHERKLLKLARTQYHKETQSKTELEVLLKCAVDKVFGERKTHRKQAQQKIYTNQAGLGVTSRKGDLGNTHEEEELNQHERERVIELLLSQDRVISLLYDKTFHMTSVNEQNQMGVQQDLEYLRK